MRKLTTVLGALALALLGACPGDPPGPTPLPDFGPLPDIPQVDEGGVDTGTADGADTGDGTIGDGVADPGPVDTGADIEPDIVVPCTLDTECDGQFNLDTCEEAWCDTAAGQCAVRAIPKCCEADTDCLPEKLIFPDISPCEDTRCNLDTNQCETFEHTANCCAEDVDCADLETNCCTTATCNQLTGQCEAETLPECCETSADCDDAVAATTDLCESTCVANGCLHQAPPCQSTTVYAKKAFDDGTLQSLKVIDVEPTDNVFWAVTSTTSVSPPYSIHLGDPACGTYYNGPMAGCVPTSPFKDDATNISVKLETEGIALGGETGSYLSFWIRMSAEEACPGCGPGGENFDIDYLIVTIDDGSGEPDEVWRSTEALGYENTTHGEWVFQTVNLSSYTGSVKVAFSFITLDPSNNYGPVGGIYEGVYLDEIQIGATCESAACTAGDPICVPDGSGCTADTCTLFSNTAGGVCAYQKAPDTLGAKCQGCGQAADCGSDPCRDYACVDGICQVGLKAECCAPNSFFPTLTQAPAVATEGFEAGDLTGWAIDDPFPDDNVGWIIDPGVSFDGAWALFFGDSTSQTYEAFDDTNAPQPAVGTVWTPPIKLPPLDFRVPVVQFWLNMSTEWDGTSGPGSEAENFDTLRLLVQTDVFSDPTELWSSFDTIGNSTQGEWAHIGADLSAYAGKTVRLGLAFDSGDFPGTGTANNYAGVRIDELHVSSFCGGASPCFGGADCDDGDPCTLDVCSLGQCTNPKGDAACCSTNADCDDGNSCTTETCDLPADGGKGSCEYAYDESQPTCCSEGPWLGAFTMGFENGLGAFTTEADTPPVVWHATGDDAYAGQQSAGFANPTSNNYQLLLGGLTQQVSGRLLTPEVGVPPYGAGSSYMQFALRMETEWDTSADSFNALFSYIDELSVTVVVDGVDEGEPAWTSHFTHNSTFGEWIITRVDLTPWAGQLVQLAFDFDSGDPSNNNFDGPFIDSVSFGTTCLSAGQVECIDGSECGTSDPCRVAVCSEDFKCGEKLKPTPQCCEPAPVSALEQSFESEPTGWSFESCSPSLAVGDPESIWKSANAISGAGIPPKSGTKFLYFGNGQDYGGSKNQGSCGVATSPEIALTDGVPWDLSMWLFLDIEAPPECDGAAAWADQFEIVVLDAPTGTQLATLFEKSDFSCAQFGKWVEWTADLSNYAGKTIQLEARFDSFDNVENGTRGIGIDGVQFVKGCVEAP